MFPETTLTDCAFEAPEIVAFPLIAQVQVVIPFGPEYVVLTLGQTLLVDGNMEHTGNGFTVTEITLLFTMQVY